MGIVRPFRKSDIPQVSEIHRRVLGGPQAQQVDAGGYASHLREVYFCSPWQACGVDSFVYVEHDGRITGFVGALARRMSQGGRTFTAAVCADFCVDPANRGMAGVLLLKRFLDGPQDFSIADEANDTARGMWEALGGSVSLQHSIRWTRVLRPARLMLNLLEKRAAAQILRPALLPLARLADELAVRMPAAPYYQVAPSLSAGQLDGKMLREGLADLAGKRLMRPEYDDREAQWLLERAGRIRGHGNFRKVLVTEQTAQPVGWYVYYSKPGGTCEVLQLAARPGRSLDVLDHLSYQAWREGALALTGALSPPFLQALADRYCLLQSGARWMLIHSRQRELLECFLRGDALISRLDGEWCHHMATPEIPLAMEPGLALHKNPVPAPCAGRSN